MRPLFLPLCLSLLFACSPASSTPESSAEEETTIEVVEEVEEVVEVIEESTEEDVEEEIDETDEIDLILKTLAISPGDQVADVGAGSGEYTEALAEYVGVEGRVWSTEVDEDDVEDLREDFGDMEHVSVVLGDAVDTGLPKNCCDAILLRLVYHHFTDPPPMRASLRRALRPDARLVVIDIQPQTDWRVLDGVPDRGGHGIPMDALIEEMTGDGFEVVERYEEWPEGEDRYCVVFRKLP